MEKYKFIKNNVDSEIEQEIMLPAEHKKNPPRTTASSRYNT